MASGRWLGVRLDLLASMLIGVVSLAAVLVSQDAGRYICKVFKVKNRTKNNTKFEDFWSAGVDQDGCGFLSSAK